MNIVLVKAKEVGGGATTSRPTEAFDELHEAHDVVDGGVGEHLDVVGADEGLEDVKDRSLGLSCVGEERQRVVGAELSRHSAGTAPPQTWTDRTHVPMEYSPSR